VDGGKVRPTTPNHHNPVSLAHELSGPQPRTASASPRGRPPTLPCPACNSSGQLSISVRASPQRPNLLTCRQWRNPTSPKSSGRTETDTNPGFNHALPVDRETPVLSGSQVGDDRPRAGRIPSSSRRPSAPRNWPRRQRRCFWRPASRWRSSRRFGALLHRRDGQHLHQGPLGPETARPPKHRKPI